MECAGVMLPSKNQDACLVQGTWMGVADGVGQWMDLGIDPGHFARELMENCRSLTSQESPGRRRRTPKDVIAEAVPMCKSAGSSTVVLACIDDSTLYAASLGDSGFLVIRGDDWSVAESSSIMQSSFSSPLQVGHLPDQNDHPENATAYEVELDDPGIAEAYRVELREGDIVVMATDGLLDYLFPGKIVRIVKRCIQLEGRGLEECAVRLAEKARSRMRNSNPYFDASVRGLKLDDITILLARVNGKGNQQTMVKVLRNEDYGASGLTIDNVVKPGDELVSSSVDAVDVLSLECAARALPANAAHSHDAYFVEGCWMGVASEQCGDGFPASLWGLCGKYSVKLMGKCKLLAKGGKGKPKGVLVTAAMKTTMAKLVDRTSTLLVAGLLEGGVLHVANVGDSRVIVIRQGQVVAETRPMRHDVAEDEEINVHPFDKPFVVGGGAGSDARRVAEAYKFGVVEGDLIVCGSSGVFNNLYVSKIARIVGKCRDVKAAAEMLVDKAREAMVAASPRMQGFAEKTQYKVLKVTDITAIVARVSSSSN